MKYLKLKIWALVISVILLGVGYYLYKFSSISVSNNFGEPLYNLMQFLVASLVLSLLMKDEIFKVWRFVFMGSIILIFLDLVTISGNCPDSLPVFCTKADNAGIDGFLFMILTGIFVVVSLIWSLMDYVKNKKQNI